MFYNCILLIIGNDINPQTDREVLLCLTMIILGAFIEAYIIGGITIEMSKGQHQIVNTSKLVEYVSFSMDIHVLPNRIRSSVM